MMEWRTSNRVWDPESEREEMIQEVAKDYVKRFPPDARGNIHVKMVRLEVEALKP